MTKAELVELIQEAAEVSHAQADRYIECLGDIMVAELLDGGVVPLPHIGKLYVRSTAARAGRNPKTGQPIRIAAGRRVGLKVGKELKEALR
jgi:nucleoid DNA-binding protein